MKKLNFIASPNEIMVELELITYDIDLSLWVVVKTRKGTRGDLPEFCLHSKFLMYFATSFIFSKNFAFEVSHQPRLCARPNFPICWLELYSFGKSHFRDSY